MRLVFFGSGEIGRASLASLVRAGFAPVLVVTRPKRRRRRRGGEEPTPVHGLALDEGVDVVTPADVNAEDSLARLRAADAGLFVVAEFGQILSQALLDIPALGSINVHTSLLPRHRGATPIEAALLAGDEVTGVTIQRVVRKLDAGPVLAQREIPIEPTDDRGTLAERMARVGGALLVEVVEAFARGEPPAGTPQDESRATICRRHRREDSVVDWTRPAISIERQVRAFAPRPGARTILAHDPELELVLRRVEAVAGGGEAGAVVEVTRDWFEVAAGQGRVRVLELVPAGRPPMEARAFLNGYRLSEGERFR